jgi:hypothetical protein
MFRANILQPRQTKYPEINYPQYQFTLLNTVSSNIGGLDLRTIFSQNMPKQRNKQEITELFKQAQPSTSARDTLGLISPISHNILSL